jgi:hypothetical protein
MRYPPKYGKSHQHAGLENSRLVLAEELGDFSDKDARDAAVTRERLEEIKKNPDLLITGDALQAELEKLLS